MATRHVEYPNGYMKYSTREEAENINRERAKERYRTKKEKILQQQREKYHQDKLLSQMQQQQLILYQQLLTYQQQLLNRNQSATPTFVLEIVDK